MMSDRRSSESGREYQKEVYGGINMLGLSVKVGVDWHAVIYRRYDDGIYYRSQVLW